MKRASKLSIILIIVILMVAMVLPACSNKNNVYDGETRTVVDSLGREVEVPANPNMICTLSSFAGPLVCLYGYSDKMMATNNNVLRNTFLKSLCPSLEYAIVVKNSGTMNAESIQALKTDLIFIDNDMYSDPNERAKLDVMGIPYVVVCYETMEQQIEAAMVVGKALGCEDIAQKYVDFYRQAINDVSSTIEAATNRKVYKIYHSINEATRTDAPNDICDNWISVAKCINVATSSTLSVDDGKTIASLEQILEWDPEVVICNEPGVDDNIMSSTAWSGVNAVINNRVYQIPVGITRYGHPNGIETALAIYWLGTKLYPELFDFTIEQKMKEFYKMFFGIDISDEVIAQLITGDGVRTPKVNN